MGFNSGFKGFNSQVITGNYETLFRIKFRLLAVANIFEPEVVFLFCFCCEGLQPPGVNHPTQDDVFGMSTRYEFCY